MGTHPATKHESLRGGGECKADDGADIAMSVL